MVFAGIFNKNMFVDEVEKILASEEGGRITSSIETEPIDFKEEAGRRVRGSIEPGHSENPEAAKALADEVACMANTPGGGVLILGVEDRTGNIIGTELDVDWLRHRIYRAVTVAPDIAIHIVAGQRLLVLYIPPAREPVENTSGQLRWRVGSNCVPIDRAKWWEQRDQQFDFDPMMQRSDMTIENVRVEAVERSRQYHTGATSTVEEYLRQTGALRSDGYLSNAGALLFTGQSRAQLEATVFDVPAGQVRNRFVPEPGLGLVEQLFQVEAFLKSVNHATTRQTGLVHEQIRHVPESSVREALLNGIIHRDWNRAEPTDIRWIEADSSLTVRSPGAFPGEITAQNILSARQSRYPALADLFRAIGLVDQQGVGVDRMYRDMIILGHQPPHIEEVAGPYVECNLYGGEPVYPVLDCVQAFVPATRRHDYRMALVLYLLLHKPFVEVSDVAEIMQSADEAARAAIAMARQTTVDGVPLIAPHKDVWILGEGARKIVSSTKDPSGIYDVVAYLNADSEQQTAVVDYWMDRLGTITTGDLMVLTGSARGTARRRLDEMVDDGALIQKGSGRASRYERP
ncbi:DUF5635 domain-containing protein [Enteractinococcus helveticum]|uniref:Transcriptional regulator n=1 Tax=Enteractinococcus helveticum TaxID=1837282 RepID=A0A1B7M0S5_9MICC|nr:DUF5635 domain-containing protein [Enteractinococcus helveticum]OAV61857.1 transcriptional regulator [Enteractinococcus helveticum]